MQKSNLKEIGTLCDLWNFTELMQNFYWNHKFLNIRTKFGVLGSSAFKFLWLFCFPNYSPAPLDFLLCPSSISTNDFRLQLSYILICLLAPLGFTFRFSAVFVTDSRLRLFCSLVCFLTSFDLPLCTSIASTNDFRFQPSYSFLCFLVPLEFTLCPFTILSSDFRLQLS